MNDSDKNNNEYQTLENYQTEQDNLEIDNKIPSTLLVCRKIQNQESMVPFKILFDTGGSSTMIHERCLPVGATPSLLPNHMKFQTVAGILSSTRSVYLEDVTLPEFDKTKRINGTSAYVFNSPCNYDMIVGRDILNKIGLSMCFDTKTMKWLESIIPMKTHTFWQTPLSYFWAFDDDGEEETLESLAATQILDAKYEKINIDDVIQAQTHLNSDQKSKLHNVLIQYNTLFDGGLGHYQKSKVHIDIDPSVPPRHFKPYPIPKIHLPTFKKELDHLVQIGVLEKAGMSAWASPTFITPKKDGRVRWVSDLRYLNTAVKRKQYPIPVIQDVLTRRDGYKYFTKLDLTMQYYALELDDESKELCTIVTPFGKYRYRRLPMGLKISPDIAQALMEQILEDLDVEVYIDDIAIFSKDYDEHMTKVNTVLQRLQATGFKINPLKCEWCVAETDFLGYWMTPTGIKPWKKKIDAILKMKPPTNVKELRSFLGAVTYYRNMWPRRSHLLAPLSNLTGKTKFEWTSDCQKAFETMKSILSTDVLLAYPNHNLPFEIYSDASDYQMGAAILQNGRPVAYWSRKLNSTQRNYTTMEKELLAIVMCLKEFRSMLMGAQLTVYTDHRNLTFRTMNPQRVLRWKIFLEDFSPQLKYIEGKDNVLADCFSRLPRMEAPSEGKRLAPGKGHLIAFDTIPKQIERDEIDEAYGYESEYNVSNNTGISEKINSCFISEGRNSFYDEEILDMFVNHPALEIMPNPITIRNIQQHQFMDEALNQAHQREPNRFPTRFVQNRPIICYIPDLNNIQAWKIALPSQLINPTIQWYHETLGHCGINRLYESIRQHFHVPGLRQKCEAYKCTVCQKNKLLGPGYGMLPPREAPLAPWSEVMIDLIGPWKIQINNEDVYFNALTCIDPVTNLVEIIRIENKTAQHVSRKFEECWLNRYPRPNRCIHDNGGEFIGWEFQRLLTQCGVEDKPTTSRNPQANAICERLHQTVANILRTIIIDNPPQHIDQATSAMDHALSTAMHVTRCATSRTLGISPGALVFQRDMFLDLPIVADLVQIQRKRQIMIDENLIRQNNKRRDFNYTVGQEVLIKTVNPSKLEPRAHGPYRIERVYTNGTIDVLRRENVIERINIRRVIPFRR